MERAGLGCKQIDPLHRPVDSELVPDANEHFRAVGRLTVRRHNLDRACLR